MTSAAPAAPGVVGTVLMVDDDETLLAAMSPGLRTHSGGFSGPAPPRARESLPRSRPPGWAPRRTGRPPRRDSAHDPAGGPGPGHRPHGTPRPDSSPATGGFTDGRARPVRAASDPWPGHAE